jgi:hypothetical protein
MNIIYCFWTGDNEITQNRKDCLEQLINTTECTVKLITKKDLHEYILPAYPLHPGYEYLSETHKADYLRCYFMHFHGGGYTDIKRTTGSWKNAFEEFNQSVYWICGYPETDSNVAYTPLISKWTELIGAGAFICKPQTEFTNEWYTEMISVLDKKLKDLKENPAKFPQDCKEKSEYFFYISNSQYPIEWNELLGRIFHKIVYKYKKNIINTLPMPIFNIAYR